jgi:acyl carrier protein
MQTEQEVIGILSEVLNLEERADTLDRNSILLGGLPELDSMAVVAVLTAIEERFGFTIDDDELDASNFATVGTLSDFVANKLNA